MNALRPQPSPLALTVRAVLLVLTASVIVAGLALAAELELLDSDASIPVGLALTSSVVAGVVGWLALRRVPWVPWAQLCQLIGVWVAAALVRHADVAPSVRVVAGAAWLAGSALPTVVLATVPHGPDPRERRPLVAGTLVVSATGIAAAVLGGSAGPGSALETHTSVPPGSAATLAYWANSVTLLIFTGVMARRRLTPWAPPRTQRALWSAWIALLIVERVTLGLPRSVVLASPGDGPGLAPWASVLAVNLPTATVGGLFAAVGYLVVVRPRLDRRPDGRLVVQPPPPATLRSDLATWLGDPSLAIDTATEDGGWVGEDGRPQSSTAQPGQLTVIVTVEDRRAARVRLDAASATPELVAVATHLAGRAMQAEALARAAEARVAVASGLAAQLVTADDIVTNRMLADLRSGPLRELNVLAAAVRGGGPLGPVADEIRAVTSRTRELSHGLHPAELTDGGLAAAHPDRVGIPRRRLPRAVEVTVHRLLVDDPAATVHDAMTHVQVLRSRTELERDVADRLRVLDAVVDGASIMIPVGVT